MNSRRSSRALLLSSALCLHGCSAFTAVRSAEVRPGSSIDVGVTVATPPGDAAAWFWSYDCAVGCNRTIPAIDVAYTRGFLQEDLGAPFEIGIGLSGFYAYGHAYAQLGRGRRPWGVGGRLAAGPSNWFETAVHIRYDVPIGPRTRLLAVPTLFAHWGTSPNGGNPGRLLAFAQGIGLETRAGSVGVTPSVLLVASRVERVSFSQRLEDYSIFAILGVSMRFGP